MASTVNVVSFLDVSMNFCNPGCTGGTGGKGISPQLSSEKKAINSSQFFKTMDELGKEVTENFPLLITEEKEIGYKNNSVVSNS